MSPPPRVPVRQRLTVVIRGIVQGVGFRYFLRREAARVGVQGWVANRADGAVELVAEGDRPDLERLLEVASTGPSGAVVRAVDIDWRPATGEFASFDIRAGGHSGD